jgi:hypothetical protein
MNVYFPDAQTGNESDLINLRMQSGCALAPSLGQGIAGEEKGAKQVAVGTST